MNNIQNAQMVLETVCEFFNVTEEMLKSKVRRRETHNYPRMYYFWLCRECFHGEEGMSFSFIGSLVNRDHATVMYGINAIKEQFQIDKEMERNAIALKHKVEGLKGEYNLHLELAAGEYIGSLKEWVEGQKADYKTMKLLVENDRTMEGWIRKKFRDHLKLMEQNLKIAETFPNVFNRVKENLFSEIQELEKLQELRKTV